MRRGDGGSNRADKEMSDSDRGGKQIIISQSGLDAILAAVKDYYERIRELETDININVDGGTPKSTDLLLVKGGTPFTTDYDKYIAGTSHTI